jgi:hypothetical protein
VYARFNPIERYEPSHEQMRARQQAIYEKYVAEATRVPGPFRNEAGARKDLMFFNRPGIVTVTFGRRGNGQEQSYRMPQDLPQFIRDTMFRQSYGVQVRDSYVIGGSMQPSIKGVLAARDRYNDPDALMLNRQDYEETLGLARKDNFYRVVFEPTASGDRYTVWPLPPGQEIPRLYRTEREAEAQAAKLNRQADPRVTGNWWQVPPNEYTERDLQSWLPPRSYWDSIT